MPVTAKLSKAFYERLGENIANELVDWFNQVDATYRTDLRELNELNYGRFEAKLEQRIAELDAKVEVRVAELATVLRQEIRGLDTRFDGLDTRFGGLEKRFDGLEKRFDGLEKHVYGLEHHIDRVRADLIKWTFVFWATTALVVIGIVTRFG